MKKYIASLLFVASTTFCPTFAKGALCDGTSDTLINKPTKIAIGVNPLCAVRELAETFAREGQKLYYNSVTCTDEEGNTTLATDLIPSDIKNSALSEEGLEKAVQIFLDLEINCNKNLNTEEINQLKSHYIKARMAAAENNKENPVDTFFEVATMLQGVTGNTDAEKLFKKDFLNKWRFLVGKNLMKNLFNKN